MSLFGGWHPHISPVSRQRQVILEQLLGRSACSFALLRDATGMGDLVLKRRIETLVAEGLIRRLPSASSGVFGTAHYSYGLTEKGRVAVERLSMTG